MSLPNPSSEFQSVPVQPKYEYEEKDQSSEEAPNPPSQVPHHLDDGRIPPKPLPSHRKQWSGFLYLIFNLIVAIVFLVLGIMIAALKDKPKSSRGDMIIQATNIAPTLWPIFFATIAGGAQKLYAQHKVESGTSLGSLELFIGSQTVTSVARTAWMLRSFGPVTFALLALWCFSIVGSQASFRGVYLRRTTIHDSSPILYRNSSMFHDASGNSLMGTNAWQTEGEFVRSMYGAAMMALSSSVRPSDASDLWNNVRIPHVESLPTYDPKQPDKWISVQPGMNSSAYAALVGIPMRCETDPPGLNSTFAISANYNTFKFSNWTTIEAADMKLKWVPENFNRFRRYLRNSTVQANINNQTYLSSLYSDLFPSFGGFFFEPLGNHSANIDDPNDTPLSLMFGTHGENDYYVTEGTIHTVYVDMNVDCSQPGRTRSCAATEVRMAPNPMTPYNRTGLDVNSIARILANQFPSLLGPRIALASSATEFYIWDPASAFNHQFESTVDLGRMPIDVFQQRFSLLYNTFWKASVKGLYITGTDWNQTDFPNDFVSTTRTTARDGVSVYTLDVPWLVMYFVSVFVLLLASVAGIVLKTLTRTPEVFGYVNSLVRDSPYVNAAGGTYMSGGDRARLMKHQRVRLADVRPGEAVGRIALVDMRHEVAAPTTHGKLYE
ncbi:hypothetical protein EJ06DRAFT_528518 [Trichodelitschia bisporula]|uniref:Uncharacterized protein n=1 Tax=Trichodelitschia bisporula TaxID=703511 RepID=A0A6G1I2X0_9PEZI|nr:hypothetical protein EJ06DRAFT_528518 [Trichodelitschia bisporula]